MQQFAFCMHNSHGRCWSHEVRNLQCGYRVYGFIPVLAAFACTEHVQCVIIFFEATSYSGKFDGLSGWIQGYLFVLLADIWLFLRTVNNEKNNIILKLIYLFCFLQNTGCISTFS